jgi:hypothetical protein
MDRVSEAGLRLVLPGGLPAAALKGLPGLRLDWSGLDRAVRLIARLGAAPVRRGKNGAPERDFAAVRAGRGAGATSRRAMLLANAQGLSPGAAIALAGGAPRYYAAEHNAGGAKDGAGGQSARSGGAEARSAVREGVKAAARAMLQAQSDVHVGAGVDPANFAALGGPPQLDMAAVTGMGQAGSTMRAATRLPAWMAGAIFGAQPGMAMGTGGGHASTWAAPTWMQASAGLVRPGDGGAAGENLAWLAPVGGSPAAPYAAPIATEAVRERSFFSGQGHGEPFPSLVGSYAADAWAGPARTPGAGAPPEDGAAFAGFGAAEEAKRRVLDEMARLASRPPAGITGFDAGQTPAWLGGWTGGT